MVCRVRAKFGATRHTLVESEIPLTEIGQNLVDTGPNLVEPGSNLSVLVATLDRAPEAATEYSQDTLKASLSAGPVSGQTPRTTTLLEDYSPEHP